MGLLMRSAPPVLEPSPPLTDEQELRAELARYETELRGIERKLQDAEAERDAADALIAAVSGRTGNAMELWRAEEARDAALALIAELSPQRRAINDKRARLATYLGPIDQELWEVDNLTRSLAAWQKLAEALPLLDQIAAIVEAARVAGKDCGNHFSVDSALLRIVRTLGPQATGLERTRVEYTIDKAIEGHRERLAALQAGVR